MRDSTQPSVSGDINCRGCGESGILAKRLPRNPERQDRFKRQQAYQNIQLKAILLYPGLDYLKKQIQSKVSVIPDFGPKFKGCHPLILQDSGEPAPNSVALQLMSHVNLGMSV